MKISPLMMVLDVKSRGGGQRKIASHHWDSVPIQKVKKLPELSLKIVPCNISIKHSDPKNV